jgi:uncharacterized tellurite resistance protein B-like protein
MSPASLLFDLTLLYLALTYGADGHLDEVELDAMSAQLQDWAPGMDPARFDHVLNEAMLAYTNGLKGDRFDQLLARLHAALDPDSRQRVLDDLRMLAAADQEVHHGELALIDRVEGAWAGE